MHQNLIKIFTLAMLLLSGPVFAACEDGVVQTISGKKFCLSKFLSNWWTGFTWCESQGGHFATFQELCDMAPTTGGTGTCGARSAAFTRSGGIAYTYVWTAAPYLDTKAYRVIYYGAVSIENRSTAANTGLICKIPD